MHGIQEMITYITSKINPMILEIAARIPEYEGMQNEQIVQNVIENQILLRSIESENDIKDAFSIEKDLGFGGIAECISYLLRRQEEPYTEECRNCNYIDDDYFCMKTGYKVNPNFCGKPCFSRKNGIL